MAHKPVLRVHARGRARRPDLLVRPTRTSARSASPSRNCYECRSRSSSASGHELGAGRVEDRRRVPALTRPIRPVEHMASPRDRPHTGEDTGLSDRPPRPSRMGEHVRSSIEQNPTIRRPKSTARAVTPRPGQVPRQRVAHRDALPGHRREPAEHLIASHCKPGATATTPSGWTARTGCCSRRPSITVRPRVHRLREGGELLVSPVAHEVSLRKMGVPVGQRVNVGGFSQGQRRYLAYSDDHDRSFRDRDRRGA